MLKKTEAVAGARCEAKLGTCWTPVEIELVKDGQWFVKPITGGRRTKVTHLAQLRPGRTFHTTVETPPVAQDEPAAPKAVKAPENATSDSEGTQGTRRMSCLDAAARILAGSGIPMSTKDLIAEMATRNLWSSPGGKTPAATLNSAIIREIAKLGPTSRFVKTDRGRYAAQAN